MSAGLDPFIGYCLATLAYCEASASCQVEMQDPEGSRYIRGLATPWSHGNGEKESYALLITNQHILYILWWFASLWYIMSSGCINSLGLAESDRKDRRPPLSKIKKLCTTVGML